MRLALMLILSFQATAYALECTGTPKSFTWNDPQLKIDSDNSVVGLAHNDEGVGYGYEIQKLEGPAGQLYRAMGLKQGDVIIAMNGVDFDSPFRATTDLASAAALKSFCLIYERKGKRIAQSFIRHEKKAKTH